MTNGTRREWGVSVTFRPLFIPGKEPVSIVQEAGWAPGPVWTGVESLAPTGIRSPDRPARSRSLYRVRNPAHFVTSVLLKIEHTYTKEYFQKHTWRLNCCDIGRNIVSDTTHVSSYKYCIYQHATPVTSYRKKKFRCYCIISSASQSSVWFTSAVFSFKIRLLV
jgi:hypothetical protein